MRPLLALLLCLVVAPAWATTYYVDPGAGNDANNGTSTGTAWKTLPGTRNGTDAAYVSAAWGALDGTSNAKRVQCGDTINIKAGTSLQANILIGPTFYQDVTACDVVSTPILIQDSAAWGTTGNVTIDATGITTLIQGTGGSCPRCAGQGVSAAVWIVVGGVRLVGLDNLNKLVFRNADGLTGDYLVLVYPAGTTLSGFYGQWWTLEHSRNGFNIGNFSNWQIANSTGTDIGSGVWQTGVRNDHTIANGAFVDVEADNSGCGSSARPACTAGSGDEDLFFFVGGSSIDKGLWCVRCTAHDGGERGVNSGVIFNPGQTTDWWWRFRDLVSYSNGNGPQPCQGTHGCSGAGIDISGNESDAACPTCINWNLVEGAILWGNYSLGAHDYANGVLDLWNATGYHTNIGRTDLGFLELDTTAGGFRLWNALNQKTINEKAFSGTPNNSGVGLQLEVTPVTGTNCFRSLSLDSEALGSSRVDGWPGTGTYQTPPAWIGATNQTTQAFCQPRIATLSTSSYAANDFRLCTGVNQPVNGCPGPSSAIDGGRSYLRANGGGTGNTITVKDNGDQSDPRAYFIAQTGTYPLPLTSDTEFQIQGACGVRHVVSMTATTITFDGTACTWTNGALVHRPWQGNAPDQGALESGGTGFATTTTTSTSTSSTSSTSSSTVTTSTVLGATTSTTLAITGRVRFRGGRYRCRSHP